MTVNEVFTNCNFNEVNISENSNFFLIFEKKSLPEFYLFDKNGFSDSVENFPENCDLICFSDEENKISELNIGCNQKILLSESTESVFYAELLVREFSSESRYSRSISDSLADILFLKISENIAKQPEIPENPPISITSPQEIRRRIYAEPYVQMSVDSAASETGMSRSGFQHLYKKTFGVSFIEDMINSRISFAKRCLRETELNVKEISEKCGYKTFAHFDRQFKKKTGMSPLEYRLTFLFAKKEK